MCIYVMQVPLISNIQVSILSPHLLYIYTLWNKEKNRIGHQEGKTDYEQKKTNTFEEGNVISDIK